MSRGRSDDYLILGSGYDRVHEAGVIRGIAVLVAIGIDWEGRRYVLAAAMAEHESTSIWSPGVSSAKKPAFERKAA